MITLASIGLEIKAWCNFKKKLVVTNIEQDFVTQDCQQQQIRLIRWIRQEANTEREMANYLLTGENMVKMRDAKRQSNVYFSVLIPQISINNIFFQKHKFTRTFHQRKILYPWLCFVFALAFIFCKNVKDKGRFHETVESKGQKHYCNYS